MNGILGVFCWGSLDLHQGPIEVPKPSIGILVLEQNNKG